eukprot:7215163-Heterocapsa_arctica.AAC.1
MAILEEERVESMPYAAENRTRGALASGGARLWGAYAARLENPECDVPGLGFTRVALSDTTGTLNDKQCVVICQGRVYEGDC